MTDGDSGNEPDDATGAPSRHALPSADRSAGARIPDYVSWKDQRAYNALLGGVCEPCYLYGQKKKTRLPNRTKALNHWSSDGSGHRDRAATIKDCLYAHKVVGLVAYARVENKQRALSKQMKQDEAARQCEVDMVIDSDDPTELGPPPRRSVVSKQSAIGSPE